ncbi:MAG TPA: IS66 family transposase [Dehalococcoidales bacterium]|nr:IS66 family transposase [Dehalococcoidales bacterium]
METLLPKTIEECHQVIRLLLNKLDELSKRFDGLEIENKQLRLENTQLKERLNNNSSNSSLPPSKSFKKKKNNRQSSGKTSGGQPGHKGHYRKLVPNDEVDSIENCALPERCICGGKIQLNGNYVRHQVFELPILKLQITEYQLSKGCCEECDQKYIASLPAGVTWGITGARLTSFMSNLVAKYGLSRREQKLFLEEHFQFCISLGTVFNKQKIVNAAMETPVRELLPLVKKSHGVHSDETGHNRDGKNQWMWGFISNTAAFFSIQASRGKKVLHSLLGDFKNILISDRYVVYNMFDSSRRQICWAHLKRDFTKLSEKDNKILARIGKNLLECESKLFKMWHDFKNEKITRDELLRQAEPVRCRIGELLEQGSYTDPLLRAARFCKNLLENFNALWTFLEIDDIEPTNNHAERSLRPAVIWRKKYFCTRSDYGTEYVARSVSINATCKLQKKSSFNFLCTLLQNHFSGINTPALLLMS